MKFFVYDPNTSKNKWKCFQLFFISKNWQKKYITLVLVVWYKQNWSKKILKKKDFFLNSFLYQIYIYFDTSFVDSRDKDEISPILQKFPDTVDGPALHYST